MRPRLLDLFCGAGGAAVGYHRAGFDVVGVDIAPRPRYPFPFVQGDALTFDLDGFDAIHASPPCQAFSVTRHAHTVDHPDLLTPTLARLEAVTVPWVVENVPGAPLVNAVVLCGASFGLVAVDGDGRPLVLRRHRLFASNVAHLVPPCACATYRRAGVAVGGVYGGGSSDRNHAREVRRGGYTPHNAVRRDLLGVDWPATMHELSQMIPPAYTEHLGAGLLAALGLPARPGVVMGDPL